MRTDRYRFSNGRPPSSSSLCMALVGQTTLTMKAEGILRAAAIDARVVRVDPQHAKKGCSYALSFPCEQEQNLRQVCKNSGIRLRAVYPAEN